VLLLGRAIKPGSEASVTEDWEGKARSQGSSLGKKCMEEGRGLEKKHRRSMLHPYEITGLNLRGGVGD